jgi:hypothetical protein
MTYDYSMMLGSFFFLFAFLAFLPDKASSKFYYSLEALG